MCKTDSECVVDAHADLLHTRAHHQTGCHAEQHEQTQTINDALWCMMCKCFAGNVLPLQLTIQKVLTYKLRQNVLWPSRACLEPCHALQGPLLVHGRKLMCMVKSSSAWLKAHVHGLKLMCMVEGSCAWLKAHVHAKYMYLRLGSTGTEDGGKAARHRCSPMQQTNSSKGLLSVQNEPCLRVAEMPSLEMHRGVATGIQKKLASASRCYGHSTHAHKRTAM